MNGTVYWVTGLAGAGKTTIGRALWERLRAERPTVVFLDGDTLREVFGSDLGHTEDDRRKSAMRNARLCRLLSSQGIDVVCATISMFHDIRRWNRAHIPGYREIYLRVPMSVLASRDQKGLYSGGAAGAVQNVMGLDVAVEEPETPDIVIANDGSLSVAAAVDAIYRQITAG